VTWISSDPSKAAIDAAIGAVRGVAPATVLITAAATDGSGITRTATLTVNDVFIVLGDERLLASAAGGVWLSINIKSLWG